MKWWQWTGRAVGGTLGDGRGETHQFGGFIHRAEGVMPDGKGGLRHWQDTGDGIVFTDVDPSEWADNNGRRRWDCE